MTKLNWAFIGKHAVIAALVAIPFCLALFVTDIPIWLVLAWIAGNTLFWMLREAWDHEWDFVPVFGDAQVVSEWVAPGVAFAAVLLVAVAL